MSTAVTEPPPPPPARPTGRSAGDIARFVLRGIGQTLITAGLVVLLFIVYEVWITNIFADREQAAVHKQLDQTFVSPRRDPLLPLPDGKNPTIPLGNGIANLYIPRLGQDYSFTIVEGGDPPNNSQLEKGPAHYEGTALPGQTGNFAVAGHRVGKGEPFLNLDKLQAGDAVIVETKSSWYVYRVKGLDHGLTRGDNIDGVPGREIVDPGDGDVLLPVPDHPNSNVTESLMTMTTCTPKFSAAQRMVIHAVLQNKVPVAARSGQAVLAMPPSVKALYSEVTS